MADVHDDWRLSVLSAIADGARVIAGGAGWVWGAVLCVAWMAGPACAEDLCAPLERLLADAPAAFVAGRGAAEGDQRWAAAPIVGHAVCTLWGARAGDADSLRCTVNDRADAGTVGRFYDANRAALDACVAGLPGSVQPPAWQRTSAPVATEGLRGEETVWLQRTAAARIRISLARYERTASRSFYDSVSVEYLRY